VGFDFTPCSQLRTGGPKGERREKALDQRVGLRFEGPARVRLDLLTQQPEAQLMREQLFERESTLGRMLHAREQTHVRIGRRAMHIFERLSQRRQLELAE